MGKRGPAPQPMALKLARGTLRKRDGDPAAQPQAAPAALGKSPDSLGDSGRKVWEIIGPKLVTAGVLTELDVGPFLRYCEAHDHVARLAAALESEGDTFTTKKGFVCQNPAVNQRFKWLDKIERFEARFGMSASDRCGIQVAKSTPAVPTRVRA